MEEIRVRLMGHAYSDWNSHVLSWNYGKETYKNLRLVWDDSYTHVVLFGVPQIDINVPKDNVIGLQCEPYEIYNLNTYIPYIQQNIGRYYTSDIQRFPNISEIREGITYFATTPIIEVDEFYKDKSNTMCIVASSKNTLQGHKLRHQIIDRILRTDMNINIYGRGLNHPDPRVKGAVEHKVNIFSQHKYAIVVENVLYGFVTEKLCDPIMFDCLPIYAGGNKQPFIDMHEDFCLNNKTLDQMMEMITRIYHDDGALYDKHFETLRKAKRGIMNIETTLPEFLYKTFNKLED